MWNENGPCIRCGQPHKIVSCPGVKAVEFNADTGAVVRVEYLVPIDFHRQDAIAPPQETYDKLKPRGQ